MEQKIKASVTRLKLRSSAAQGGEFPNFANIFCSSRFPEQPVHRFVKKVSRSLKSNLKFKFEKNVTKTCNVPLLLKFIFYTGDQ